MRLTVQDFYSSEHVLGELFTASLPYTGSVLCDLQVQSGSLRLHLSRFPRIKWGNWGSCCHWEENHNSEGCLQDSLYSSCAFLSICLWKHAPTHTCVQPPCRPFSWPKPPFSQTPGYLYLLSPQSGLPLPLLLYYLFQISAQGKLPRQAFPAFSVLFTILGHVLKDHTPLLPSPELRI